MDFKMNPDFPRQLQAQMNKFNAALKAVFDEHAGHDLPVVRAALRRRISAVGNGASITEPDLTNVATQISRGKRVWMEGNGKIMADD